MEHQSVLQILWCRLRQKYKEKLRKENQKFLSQTLSCSWVMQRWELFTFFFFYIRLFVAVFLRLCHKLVLQGKSGRRTTQRVLYGSHQLNLLIYGHIGAEEMAQPLKAGLTTKVGLHNRDSKLGVEKPMCIYYDLINGILPKLFLKKN